MAWLSVIMPTYNGSAYLATALESVVAQSDPDVEVILVDDGSTDATLSIAKSFAKRLRLTIVSCAHRGDWVAGTNQGMAMARGEYVCWLHQDDVWHPGRLHIVRKTVRQNPRADLIIHPVWFIDGNGRKVGRLHCPLSSEGGLLQPTQIVSRLLVQDFLASTAPVFTQRAALSAGPLDESLWLNADWDFWLKLAGSGETAYHAAPLSSMRVHRESQTMTRIDEFGRQYHEVLDRHLPLWDGVLRDYNAVAQVARFSADLNIALARWASGHPVLFGKLMAQYLALGPSGWLRYLRDSRIHERTLARIRAGVLTRCAR